MWSTPKYRLYLFFFLAFAVASSKNILIYNEETLVAVSFFCFVFFILHYFGQTVQQSLDERSTAIREQLHNFLVLKTNTYQQLYHRHDKIPGLYRAVSLANTVTTQMSLYYKQNAVQVLKNQLCMDIEKQLQTLVSKKAQVQQRLQYRLGDQILSNLLISLAKKGGDTHKTIQNTALKNAVYFLVENTKKKIDTTV